MSNVAENWLCSLIPTNALFDREVIEGPKANQHGVSHQASSTERSKNFYEVHFFKGDDHGIEGKDHRQS